METPSFVYVCRKEFLMTTTHRWVMKFVTQIAVSHSFCNFFENGCILIIDINHKLYMKNVYLILNELNFNFLLFTNFTFWR